MGGTLGGTSNGGGGFEGTESDGRGRSVGRASERSGSSLGLVRVSDPESARRLGEPVLVLASLVGVERS